MPLKKREESDWEKRLRLERSLMKKALARVKTAERWVSQGQKVDEKVLSLIWQWEQLVKEEEEKRDRLSVEKALTRPTHFQSLP